MKPRYLGQPAKRLRLLAMLAALAFGTSGCAIDGDQLLSDMVEAGLDSVTTSLVDALSGHLANN